MKKFARVGLALALVAMALVNVQAAGSTTPVKVSLFPKLSYPAQTTVHGLDLGLIATSIDEVQGVQFSLIYGKVSGKMIGWQGSFVTRGATVTGLQTGFAQHADKITGLQYGFYNGANEVTGVQLGFINVTEQMKGIQVGLVNVIKKGIIPAMVFVNASF
jgi:hypothetical protein